MARFSQDFIIDYLSLQLQLGLRWIKEKTNLASSWMWWNWLSSGRARRRQKLTGAAAHLCICPALITVYLYWLLTTFFIIQRRFFIELQKEKQNAPVSRETWAGKLVGLDSEITSLHTVARCIVTPSSSSTWSHLEITATMWDDCWCSLLNHLFIPHNDSELFIKSPGRKLGFTSRVVGGGMCSLKDIL